MDREFSKDISVYKRKAAKGFTKTELALGALTLGIGAAQIYFFIHLGIHMIIACYLAMPVTISIGFLGFYKKNGYTLFGILNKNRELAKSSGTMPYRSEEEREILKITVLPVQQKRGNRYGKKKERK